MDIFKRIQIIYRIFYSLNIQVIYQRLKVLCIIPFSNSCNFFVSTFSKTKSNYISYILFYPLFFLLSFLPLSLPLPLLLSLLPLSFFILVSFLLEVVIKFKNTYSATLYYFHSQKAPVSFSILCNSKTRSFIHSI